MGRYSLLASLLAVVCVAPLAAAEPKEGPAAPVESEKTPLELFSVESRFIGSSRFEREELGRQDAVYDFFGYSHRFPLSGQWFLRAGLEYSRTDFGSSQAPVPTKLQALCGVVAVEYVEQGYAGAAIELYPGFYFQNEIGAAAFDVPWDVFATFVISKKLYGVLGAAGGVFYEYPVIPIFGAIWLISDQVRFEGIFPKASLVYNPSEDWEFRVVGEIAGGSFRRDRDPAIDPKLRGALIQYSESRLGAQMTYSRFKPFNVVLGAGYVFDRSFEYFRAGEEFELNGAPFIKVSLTADF